MADFKSKCNATLEYRPGICQHLQDDYSFGQEGIIIGIPNYDYLHEMIGDDLRAKFPHHIDIRYFATIISSI